MSIVARHRLIHIGKAYDFMSTTGSRSHSSLLTTPPSVVSMIRGLWRLVEPIWHAPKPDLLGKSAFDDRYCGVMCAKFKLGKGHAGMTQVTHRSDPLRSTSHTDRKVCAWPV